MEDADNLEDVAELEARLYGQVHHVANTSVPGGDLQSASTNNKMESEGGALVSNRYWNRGERLVRPKKRINPFAENPPNKEQTVRENNVPISQEIKPFRPYVPYILKNEVIPDASGDDPEPKGSPSKLISVASAKQDGVTTKNVEKSGQNNPLNRKISKLSKAIKYQLKKFRANQNREKQKERNRAKAQIETIIVASSEEDDDVVEIPVPAPPTVTIESSGESESENDESGTFLKPQELPKSGEKISSRCASPSSVMSDDFIGQTDRSRYSQQENVATDEDLIFLPQTVDSCVYQNKGKNETTERVKQSDYTLKNANFVTPQRKKSSKQPNYQVTQSNFRALDVYESESSDMPDYDRDKDTTVKTKSHPESENDKERTKKLKKRRKSGSAKESEPNESSDSEKENPAEKTVFPFIRRGVAVESCKDKNLQSSASVDADPSDKEFINLLATISQPMKSPDRLSDKSVESIEEDITAREMIEDVLNKKKQPESKRVNKKDHAPIETVVVEEYESMHEDEVMKESQAVPLDTSEDIDKILDSIDKMESIVETSEPESEKCQEEEYTGDDVMMTVSDVTKNQRPNEIEPDHNGLYTVHTHGKNIGWSEEMVRFYNYSWGGENFNVKQVQKMMNPSDKWTIYTEDRFPKAKRFTNLQCFNCFERGHMKAKCPRPKKIVACCMCGETGHLEPRCPNTICLRCGNKTSVFTRSCKNCYHENRLICPICKIRGHSTQLCPDKWRRYHSTTQANEYPNKNIELNPRKFCCVCAGAGHLSEHCKSSVRFSQYPPSISEIKSYAKAYDDDLIKRPFGKNVTGYSLVSRPCEGVLFNYSHKINATQYYGRMLNAVGLDHLMTWGKKAESSKRKSESLAENEPKEKVKKKNLVLNPFAKRTREREVPTKEEQRNLEEEHPNFDIVLNTVDSNKSPQKAGTKTPTASSSVQSVQVSEDTPLKALQTQANNETTNSYTAFTKNVNNNQSTPHQSKGKCRELGPLPDFIPLNDSEDNDNDEGLLSLCGVSANLDMNHDGEDIVDSIIIDDNLDCEAKIYLTRFHSKFLLSPEGMQYLKENSKKFAVKTKIEWTSVGNVLIIEGLPSNQDKFHEQLLEMFRNLSDQTNRRELEKSQKVPKKKDILIKFLQENILQLEKPLGNVPELYKRLQNVQNMQTKNSWKTAEKTRKTLNMILMGQTGLRKGKENLDALLNDLKVLQENELMEVVPDKLRSEIGERWRYIFSSQQHENYGDLIQQYIELKKNNELPKLNLSYNLLGAKVLNVSLTDEQKQKLNNGKEMEEKKIEKKNFPEQPKFHKEPNLPKANVTPKHLDLPLIRQPQQQQQQQQRQPQFRQNMPYGTYFGGHFKPREFTAYSDSKYRNFLNSLRDPPVSGNNDSHANAIPSLFWSTECLKIIDKCLSMNPSLPTVLAKLYKLQDKAKQGQLCMNDYKVLQRIHGVLKGKIR